jgi:hypothetical protein
MKPSRCTPLPKRQRMWFEASPFGGSHWDKQNKTNKLPCFIDRLWLGLLHCFSVCFHFECGHSFACSYVFIPHSKIYCQTSLDFFYSCLQWSPPSFFIHRFSQAFIWALHSSTICFEYYEKLLFVLCFSLEIHCNFKFGECNKAYLFFCHVQSLN